MRIGGEIELDPSGLAPAALPLLESWRRRLAGSTTLASTGRAALSLVLEAIRRADPAARTFLVPSYLCGSLLPPFIRAGFDVRFVPVDANLRLPADELGRLAAATGASGVLFIDYFGSPVSEAERQALADLKRKLWVIEDCVPGGLVEQGGRGVGGLGHFAFTSFRKYTPLPDGALVWNRSDLVIETPAISEISEWVRLRLLGKLLRGEVLRQGGDVGGRLDACEQAFLQLFAVSEELLESSGGERGPSRLSAALGNFDLDEAAARRRDNGRRLHARFEERPPGWAGFLLPAPDERDSPSLMPLVCRDRSVRDGLRGHLARADIFSSIHWPLPPGVPEESCRASHELASTILCLPLDHRCGAAEMDRMHAQILAFRPS